MRQVLFRCHVYRQVRDPTAYIMRAARQRGKGPGPGLGDGHMSIHGIFAGST